MHKPILNSRGVSMALEAGETTMTKIFRKLGKICKF